MKTLLAIVIPATGVIAVIGTLGSGNGFGAALVVAVAAVSFWRFVLR